jgi:putative phosphoribosyl transferase
MSIVLPQTIKVHTGGGVTLTADLSVPRDATGVVIFAFGTGGSRLSARNRRFASSMHAFSLGTAVIDLLTPEEEAIDLETASVRFDIDRLAPRLIAATHLIIEREDLPVGYFGVSTGAAVALMAAAHHPDDVDAVVCRGGRPDLAISVLPKVKAATLLIVGGRDVRTIRANRAAYDHLACEKRLEIVPGATQLFEEPGALESVSELAGEWYEMHLQPEPAIA